MNKARSRKLLVANQFITEESRNKEAANKSFTVLVYQMAIADHASHDVIVYIKAKN
jgi:hypothetical protein